MKLKDIDFNILKFDKGVTIGEGTLFNLKTLEFQTPKVTINEILTTGDKGYLFLKLNPTEACRKFYLFILSFEQFLNKRFNRSVNKIFDEEVFKVKINIKSCKIYDNDKLCNWYHLKPETEVICLVNIDKIWINNEINYNLNIKEIMLLKNLKV